MKPKTITQIIFLFSLLLSIFSTFYFFEKNYIILYGDAESHLNIAKRVLSSPTAGLSQLGGIWLPLPHLLMAPFVHFDFLWRSGLAGSIVSGISFVVSSVLLYKLTFMITRGKFSSIFPPLIFCLNPNIIYMQSTPMTELLLIAFFIMSIYYFVKFLKNQDHYNSLVFAAFFGFCATLTRYDGWLLVLTEALILAIFYLIKTQNRKAWEGRFILFSTLAFLGIAIWIVWDFLILGNPLYFLNSPFSAKVQQQTLLTRHELPTYKNIVLSVAYYLTTSVDNIGLLISLISVVGLLTFLLRHKKGIDVLLPILLFVPFVFYVVTLYLGQSVIYEPHLTPKSFGLSLFNIRYGIVMVPFAAFFFGYLFYKSKNLIKILLLLILVLQTYFFVRDSSNILTLQDGKEGISSVRQTGAQVWIAKNYDRGFVLLDDYARAISIVRTKIPMQNVIYIGNKPYWQESLKTPEKYATWVVMQRGDTLWNSILEIPQVKARLYKYFKEVYSSPNILIFKRL